MNMRFEHDRHIDQPTLVLVADGEGDATQTAAVHSHLAGCRDCWLRMAALQALNEFVFTRRQALDRQIPPAEESRARLKKLLSAGAEAEKEKHSFRNRLSYISLPDIRPRYWMGATAAITLAAFVWVSVLTPAVSAKEFLGRAAAAQTTQGSVNRSYRFRLEGKDLKRHSEGLDRRGRSIFVAAHLDWDDPLSSTAFTRWHDQSSDRNDRVTRSGGQLTLRTTTKTDPVQEASYTVEAETWLPVSETVALRDGRNIEIIAGPKAPDSDDEAPIADRPRTPETNAAPESKTSPSTPALPLANVPTADDTEVLARVALHKLGTVDGGQIDFQKLDDGALAVRTLVESESRKQSMLAALAPIPNLRADIRTFAEAAGRSAGPVSHSTADGAVVASAVPAFQQDLETIFPNAGDRAAFVDLVLSESQHASSEAWETAALVRRYSESEVDKLRPGSRDALEALIREHADALSGAIQRVALRLRPLIALPGTAAVSPGKRWRETLLFLTQRSLALHEEIQEGLSASSQNRRSEELRISIISDLQGLESRLEESRRATRERFLSN